MKNSKYFPFERNKYFYGKLLSVDDFELEQRYANNKRRMTNRFLQGCGVAAGMYVVRIDEKTISLESGFALDSLGREIVVDVPVIRRLSVLEGYASSVENSANDSVYLCIDYEEAYAEPVHNIAGTAPVAEGGMAYNKIKETYRLYLTDAAPEEENLDKRALYEKRQILYSAQGILIRLVMPKYARAGTQAQICLEIENVTKKYLSFSFDVLLDCMEQEGNASISINFNEAQHEKTGSYVLHYPVTAADLPGAEACIQINKKSMQLFLNKEALNIEDLNKGALNKGARESDADSLNFPVQIISSDIRSQVVQDYYRSAMERIVSKNQPQRLYLAKIYLLRTYDEGEGACVIDRVENLPFHQYILNQNLSFALHQLAADGIVSDSQPHQALSGSAGAYSGKAEGSVQLAQGSYWLDLNGGGQRGDRFISEEISHGLGLGPAVVKAGLEDENGAVTYGSSEIFPDMDVMLELAVRVFPDKGTFQIAGRLREQVIKSGVMVHWAAVMHEMEKAAKKMTRRIFIKPSILELAVRENHYMEAVCTNMDDKAVEWSIQAHGGSISANGMYTAPNLPGVYEITAQSVAYPQVKASIFAVVREA